MNESEIKELAEQFRKMGDRDLLIQVATEIKVINKRMEDGDMRMNAIENRHNDYISQRQVCFDRMADIKLDAVTASKTSSMIYGILTLIVGGIIAFASAVASAKH